MGEGFAGGAAGCGGTAGLGGSALGKGCSKGGEGASRIWLLAGTGSCGEGSRRTRERRGGNSLLEAKTLAGLVSVFTGEEPAIAVLATGSGAASAVSYTHLTLPTTPYV